MGKRITDLDPYGSIDTILSKDDLFEVSKNSGTVGFPVYAPDGSRKISGAQLMELLGGIPYSGQNYEVVKATGSDTQNGTALLVAIALCYDKTPNGSVLSNTNRATIFFLGGNYDLGSDQIEIGEFVDFVSLSTKEATVITSSNIASTISVLSGNNYSFKNITVQNSGGGLSFEVDGTDNGIWGNLIISAPTSNSIYAGNYSNLIGTVDQVLQGSISGTVKDCIFENKSCGYSETLGVDIQGEISNCIGIDYCFGYSSAGYVVLSGKISNTHGRDSCFVVTVDDSTGVDITGSISNCSGRNLCFSASSSSLAFVSVSGSIDNCKANSLCFGYSSYLAGLSMTGHIYNCQIGGINGLVHASPNSHKWRKYLANDGEWQTEDLGI